MRFMRLEEQIKDRKSIRDVAARYVCDNSPQRELGTEEANENGEGGNVGIHPDKVGEDGSIHAGAHVSTEYTPEYTVDATT